MSEIYTTEELLAVESEARYSVWDFAPDIALGPQSFGPVMRKNMYERGIEYRYLVVNHTNTLLNLVEFLRNLLEEGATDKFKIRIVPREIIENDVTIIDADRSSEIAFVISPAENDSTHVRIRGPAVYRIKERFATLWRLADVIDVARIVEGGDIEDAITEQKPLNAFWPTLVRAQPGRYKRMWSRLGPIAHRLDEPGAANVTDVDLVRDQIKTIVGAGRHVPRLTEIEFPVSIERDAAALCREVLAAFIAGANSASIAMCGKLLELSLREYYVIHSDEPLSDQLMLGKLIRRVNKDLGVQLDEGLLNIVNFINQFRISGVHVKQGFSLPTDDQTQAVLYMTYDTVRKLF